MFKDHKSAKELADMVIAEARNSGKCPNLTGGTVRATGHPGDWIFTPAPSGAGVSNDCRLELIEIEMGIQKRGFCLQYHPFLRALGSAERVPRASLAGSGYWRGALRAEVHQW